MKRILYVMLMCASVPAHAQVSFLLNSTVSTYPTDGMIFDSDGVDYATARVSRAVGPGLSDQVYAIVDGTTFSIPYDPSNPFTYQAQLNWSIAAFNGCTEANLLTATADWHQQDFFFGKPLDAYIHTIVSCDGASCHVGAEQFWYGANLIKDPPIMWGTPLC